MPFSIETFGSGHSLLTNRLPPKVELSRLGLMLPEEGGVAINRFGLFESSTPDFNKYYPDVTAKDLEPQDEDFVSPIFRALSKIIINKYGPVDFSVGDVLERSAQLLVGQAVLTNHDQIVGNEVGVIMEAFFDAQRTYKGVRIPAGINVKTKLDGKANPKLVRSVMMDPPSVHSTSVTVAFAWEQSHPKMSRDEFFSKVGTLDDKGKLIRRIVTDIARYEEMSLVSHGADPFAQRVKDGKIANPEYAGRVYKFSEGDHRAVYHFFDWKEYGASNATFSLQDTIPNNSLISNNSNTNETPMNEALLKFLRASLGMEANATEAEVTAKLQVDLPLLATDRASLAQVRTELTTTKETLTALQAKLPEGSMVITKEEKTKLDSFDAIKLVHDQVLLSTREECLKLYNLSVGGEGKADASITKLIAESSFESLTALTKQYKAQVEKSFTAKCNKCGSTEITRASSANPQSGVNLPGGDGGEGGNTPKVVGTEEVYANLMKAATAPNLSNIHGQSKK